MNSPAIPPRPEPPSPGLTIRLLGDFSLLYRGEPIATVNTPRLQALLAYLLLHRHAPQSRRHLAFLFWPDSTEAQALTNLRKQLLYLRQLLPQGDGFLIADRQTVQWLSDIAVNLDVDAFHTALATAATVTDSQAILALRTAVTCYTGELLPGCYDEWIFAEREALHTQYGHALERLIQLLEAQRAYADAIVYSEQLLRYDPLHEATYRQLMRLHALNGDRAAALRVYHTGLTQLREELGVDPDEETQAAYERLLHQQTQPEAMPTLAANAPFVGRETEWQTLQRLWRTVQRGSPHFVLLAGEAGIGKSRLAEELLHWAHHQGIATARTRAYAAEGRLAYAPVMEWLRSPAVRPHLRKVAPAWLTELARLLPELLAEWPTLPPPAPLTQSWQRRHLFEALTRALLATGQPLVLLLDDLQWCDQETLAWLHFLLRFTDSAPPAGTPPARLLLMGTARLPDEVPAGHPLQTLLIGLQESRQLTQLDLARFTAIETASLARQMGSDELTVNALAQLYSDTAGNPLFVVETMRATLEQEPKAASAGHTTFGSSSAPVNSHTLAGAIPPKVLAVIQGRLGQLSPAARNLSEWAAVIGRAFTLDLLQMASKLPETEAVAALDELWQRRIIREQGADTYDFSHDRIRDVAAAGISRVRWRHLHRCVAEALAQQVDQHVDSNVAQIAAHYEAAGAVEKAIAYYEQAATYASQVYANHETVAHLQRALHLLKHLPASQERDQRELTFLNAIGPALAALTGFTSQQLGEVYERAYTLSQQLGVPPNPALLRILAVHKIGVGTFTQVQSIGIHLLALAQQPSSAIDSILYVEGSYVLGVNAFWQGQFTQAKAYLQQAVAAYSSERHEQHIADYGLDPGPYCRARLGLALWYLGFPDQARRQCELAVTLARELKHPFTIYLVLAFTVWLYCDCRDINTAKTYSHLFSSHMDAVSSQVLNVFHFLQGWCLLQQGESRLSIAKISDYIVWRRLSKTDSLYGAHAFALLVEAYIVTGDYEQGTAALEEGFAVLKGSQDYWFVAELYRLKGELILVQGGSLADAEICFQEALEIARRQEAKSLELRAAMGLSRLWGQQGRRSAARALLAEVYHWFTEGFDTPDLQEAQALLSQLQYSTV